MQTDIQHIVHTLKHIKAYFDAGQYIEAGYSLQKLIEVLGDA